MATEVKKKKRKGNKLATAASDLVKRLRFARKAGMQYGGKRNVYEVAGYVSEEELRFDHYWSIYQRQDIAGRIVDMEPMTTWKDPPIITVNDGKEDEFTKGIDEMVDRLKLWSMLERIDRLSGIGRFGVLMIGVADVVDSELIEPLEKVSRPEDVIYLKPYHEGDIKIDKWITDTGNENFGKPEVYTITVSRDTEGFQEMELRVHHTRIIHVAEGLLTDETYGMPRLKRVLNRLFDLDKITAASAEAFWQLADQILQVSVDPAVKMGDKARDDLGDAIEEIMHDLRRQIVGQGIDAKWVGGNTPDPKGAADLCLMLIAAARGIPKRILFGTETGERASQQDERAYMGKISERQEHHAEPNILRVFLDRMVSIGALKEPPKTGYVIAWPVLFEATEKDQADTSKTVAETASALTGAAGDPIELVTIDETGRVQLIPVVNEIEKVIVEEDEEDGEDDEPIVDPVIPLTLEQLEVLEAIEDNGIIETQPEV